MQLIRAGIGIGKIEQSRARINLRKKWRYLLIGYASYFKLKVLLVLEFVISDELLLILCFVTQGIAAQEKTIA